MKQLALFFCTFFFCGCALHPDIEDGPPLYESANDFDLKPLPQLTVSQSIKPGKLSPYGNPSSYVVDGKRYHVLNTANGYDKRGMASWYGRKFHGQLTSNREIYNMFALTAASKTLPIPTYAKVTNLENGRSIIVRVNDRGPFHANRIIDLSYAAAKKLGFLIKGTAPVEVKAISFGARQLAKSQMHKFLQVAAFSNQSHALALKQRLAHYIHKNIIIKPIIAASHTLYRVQIGPLVDDHESAKLHNLLKTLGLGLGKPMTLTT